MIIKSMSRKEASFGQLYDYVTRSQDNDARFHYYHNFLRLDAESIVKTFKDNAQLLPKRKNGNYLYHEVLSITRAKHLSETQQKQILHHIAHQYIQRRAGDCLVFGGIHDEKDNNLHYHLIISANKAGDNKRYRLKKAEFDTIKKELELYVLERYPELEQQKLISKKNAKKAPQVTRGEQGVKQRTGDNQKTQIKESILSCMAKARSQSDFEALLLEKQLEYYQRSAKTMGVIDRTNSKKYRLKTLGLADKFAAMQARFGNDGKIQGKTKARQKTTQQKTTPKEQVKTADTPSPSKTSSRKQQDTLTQVAQEWIMGDFSTRDAQIKTRDAQIKKEAFRKRDEADRKVKNFEDQSNVEKTGEVLSEWVMGDFSHREARERVRANEKRLAEWRKQQQETSSKDKSKTPKK